MRFYLEGSSHNYVEMDPPLLPKEKARCKHCGKEFGQNSHLNRHIREVHKIKFFKRLPSLNPPTFKCPLVHLNVPCSAVFHSQRSLQRHKARYHLEKKPRRRKVDVVRKSVVKPSAAELQRLEKYEKVKAILETFPSDCEYRVIHFFESPLSANFEFTITTVSEIKEWKKKYEEKNKIFFRKDRTVKSRKECVLFKQRYHCGRFIPNQRNSKHGERNTNCPFSFSIRVKREKTASLVVRIQLKNEHNHDPESADSVKFRPVSEGVREKFLCLFHYGCTPGKAIKTHAKDLEDEYEERVHTVKGDRYYDPDMNWVNRLHDMVFKKEYRSQYGCRMLQDLEDKVAESECAKLLVLDKAFNYVLAVVTPFMLRIHEEIDESSETVFINSTGTLDRLGCHVFTFFANSASGALPLGVIVTTVDDDASIICGLKMMQELLTETSFGGRGRKSGPLVFMADPGVLRAALREVFPDSKFLHSQFCVLQAMWHTIWTDDGNSPMCDRATLFSLFKFLVYEKDVNVCEMRVKQVFSNDLVRKHSAFVRCFEDFIKSKHEWATCFRTNLTARGQRTNSTCEAEMRIVEEVTVKRSRAFSPAHLFSILISDFEKYFVDKLESLSNYLIPSDLEEKLEKLSKKCPQESPDVSIDTENGLCSCTEAMDGKLCKHLLVALKENNIESNWIVPSSESERQKLIYIIGGRISKPEEERRMEPVSLFVPEESHPQDTYIVEEIDALPEDTYIVEEIDPLPEDPFPVEETEERPSSAVNFEEFDAMCEEIRSMAVKHASVKCALDEMVRTFHAIKTTAFLESSLRLFGKCNIEAVENIIIEDD